MKFTHVELNQLGQPMNPADLVSGIMDDPDIRAGMAVEYRTVGGRRFKVRSYWPRSGTCQAKQALRVMGRTRGELLRELDVMAPRSTRDPSVRIPAPVPTTDDEREIASLCESIRNLRHDLARGTCTNPNYSRTVLAWLERMAASLGVLDDHNR